MSYRVRRAVSAYSDIGNLYLQVWGDQWPVAVDRLRAEVVLPNETRVDERNLFRAWGHPASVRGSVRMTSSSRSR